MHDADEDGNIQAADAAHLVASHLNAAPQGHDSGASAMQLNAAPMSCTVYSTLQKPLMPKMNAAPQNHDPGASAMHLNAAPMRCSDKRLAHPGVPHPVVSHQKNRLSWRTPA